MSSKYKVSIVLPNNKKDSSRSSIKLVKKAHKKISEYLSDLPKVSAVGISQSLDEYYLIVYLEEEDLSTKKILEQLEKKYKIPIITKIVGAFQLY